MGFGTGIVFRAAGFRMLCNAFGFRSSSCSAKSKLQSLRRFKVHLYAAVWQLRCLPIYSLPESRTAHTLIMAVVLSSWLGMMAPPSCCFDANFSS